MSKFDRHFRMNEADAADYAKHRLPLFAKSGRLEAAEIGDGNINFIFRVRDPDSGASVIIKHADADTRSGTRTLGFDRKDEAKSKMEGDNAPVSCPSLRLRSRVACLSMVDLSDHVILRYELMRTKLSRLAEDFCEFMAKTSCGTRYGDGPFGRRKW